MSEEKQEEQTVDETFEKLLVDAKAKGIELTDSYIQNLRDSEDEKIKYNEAYPEAQNVFDNIVNGISEEEAEDIVEILKRGTEADKMKLAEGLVQLFS